MGKSGKTKKEKSATLLCGDWFSSAAQTALEQTFARFDEDGDGLLCVAELQAFARACNAGEEFGQDELDDLKHFDTNGEGALTRKGFMQMYHMQTIARPADTWADLKALGFDGQLKSANAASDRPHKDAPVEGAPAHTTGQAAAGDSTGSAGSATAVAESHCIRSDALYTAGNHQEALRAALAALSLSSDCEVAAQAQAQRCAGRALFALGRVDAAERSWKRANELTVDTPSPEGIAAATEIA